MHGAIAAKEVDGVKRKGRLAALAAGLSLLLSGCFFQSAEELYTLPRLTADYANLQDALEELISSGLEYAAPLSGNNTQIVQLVDLYDDGTEEAVAFFRDPAATEKPMRIYIFRQGADGQYERADMIEGEGSAFSSVTYAQLDTRPGKEIVVVGQMASGVYSASAYRLSDTGEGHEELLHSGCSRIAVRDLDGDGAGEIVLLQMDSSEDATNRAEYYDFNGTGIDLVNTVPLSGDMAAALRVRANDLQPGVPALFVSGSTGDGRLITDILAVSGRQLTNVTLDAASGSSVKTLRADPGDGIFIMDINGDGACEIPFLRRLPAYDPAAMDDVQYLVDWYQYDIDGAESLACTTYHSSAGWYITIPAAWNDCITVSHKSVRAGEDAVTFCYKPGPTDAPEAFLTIYTLTGDNREARSRAGSRQTLITTADTIYAAEFAASGWDCGLDRDSLLVRFCVIPSDWSD